MTLTNTMRRCPYGHAHRDGALVCGWLRKETKTTRVHQRRALRIANRWRLNRSLEFEQTHRTQGWGSH